MSAGTLPLVTETEPTYNERVDDGFCFKSYYRLSFTNPEDSNAKVRILELSLYQTKMDMANDPLENLLQPLIVGLIEDDGEMIYEDAYRFTTDGDFLRHSWRKKNKNTGDYECPIFTNDADISKLFRYGEQIAIMLESRQIHPAMKNHPTVQKLKTHTLWKLDD